MGINNSRRPRAALKDSSKRSSVRNRPPHRPQLNKSQIASKQQAKMSFLSKRSKAPRLKPLRKLFDRRGMAYGRRSILHTVRKDYQLRRKFLSRGIESREGVEEALLELLFQCRNLKDWDSGGDNLVDVFRLIKGRVEWAANCSVDLIMQLFFTLLRARLDCPTRLRKNAGKVALRVDKVILYINGVDHLLTEYEIYKNLALPIRKLPKKAKMPPSAMPGAVFLQAISRSSK
ncbi:hypothetical protein UCDDA912_g10060 [Diaporthe ampelina]|uniref:Uncharacterized protein n=1 Tax=Diaporthe ampelina TaxID=1214573 RepID=A0A0G2F709_9PEZI|nr:hypothetical protein UCDDA912_g10060 [Diaporthe ampelina]